MSELPELNYTFPYLLKKNHVVVYGRNKKLSSEQAAEIIRRCKWHDAKKELPPDRETCYLYIPSFNKFTTVQGHWNKSLQVWTTHAKGFFRTKKVTHWLPFFLPVQALAKEKL